MSLHTLGGNLPDPTRKSFNKAQGLSVKDGCAVFDHTKPGIGGERLKGQAKFHRATAGQYRDVVEKATKEFTPANDKDKQTQAAAHGKVLRFFCFFKEAVQENPLENFRVRKCVIFFYIDDDTIHIEETRLENSGIPQGRILRRQLVTKPGSEDLYTPFDFNVGAEPEIFGRRYHIVDVDRFTRLFLEKLGVTVPEAEPFPEDPYEPHRLEGMQSRRVPTSKHKGPDKLKRFLDNDGLVLRFYATWDDPHSMAGEQRRFALHFYLSDDTIEVVEVMQANAGRDNFPRFMFRQRLPKPFNPQIGLTEYYIDKDLTVGQTVSIYGREFYLFGCDKRTREFYRANYGVEQADLEPPESEPAYVPPEPAVPPPTGFGSDEDSLSCWKSLVAKPPKRDTYKQILNEGKILRFGGRMLTKSPVDQDRRFVISFFLADDTVSVFEPPLRNSGIVGGTFLARQKLKCNDASPPEYYKPTDLALGKVIVVHKRQFILETADEYALEYMEIHCDEYPDSDVALVMEKFKGVSIADLDANNDGTISSEELDAFLTALGVEVNPQQIMTIKRRFDLNNDGIVSVAELKKVLE